MGVARQWCGQLGKVENCQVGVFAALSRGTEATLIDGRLFLPEAWTSDSARCQAAGVPQAQRGFQRKTDLALAMIAHARHRNIGFAWVGFDGFYGSDPAFLRALDDRGEIFVGDVHKDQRIDLDDPRPIIPPAKTARGRSPTRLQALASAVRVDHWAPAATRDRLATGHLARRHQRPLARGDFASAGVAMGWPRTSGLALALDRSPGNRHADRDQI